MTRLAYPLTAALVLIASPALAHTGGAHQIGLLSGLAHPLLGLDHILAMVAIGVLAFQMKSSSRVTLPALFAGMMLLGAFAGFAQIQIPFVEQGILGSVIILGAVIAAGSRLSLKILLPLVALFGASHGVAHGAEVPANATTALYALGFIAATFSLMFAGFVLGNLTTATFRKATGTAIRITGLAVAFCGLGLAFA